MGYRTVVMLNNDLSHLWTKDVALGQRIFRAAGQANDDGADLGYGRVVECCHADQQTLVKLEHYTGFDAVAYRGWRQGDTEETAQLSLLKQAAEAMGYRLVKKAK